MDNKLKCRKCGGEHLTIKCNKNKETKNENIIEIKNIIETKNENITEFKNKEFKNENIIETKNNFYNINKKNKVKISNLPIDITKEEIYYLLNEWNVKTINIKKTNECMIAYVEFKYNIGVYFSESLDRTIFDHQIINVEPITT